MWLKRASFRFLDRLIALLEGWRARLEEVEEPGQVEELEEVKEPEIEQVEEPEIEEAEEPKRDPPPVVVYPEGAPPPVTEPKRGLEYTEPDDPPEGCLRVRYNGGGSVIINDYRGWSVQIKRGEDLIVTDETWKNMNDPDLAMTRPGTWERI